MTSFEDFILMISLGTMYCGSRYCTIHVDVKRAGHGEMMSVGTRLKAHDGCCHLTVGPWSALVGSFSSPSTFDNRQLHELAETRPTQWVTCITSKPIL